LEQRVSGDTRLESGGTATLAVDEHEPGVIALWLNRPQSRNALDRALVAALAAQFRRADTRAFVLGSSDSRCFCAGADLTLDDAERSEVSNRLYELYGVMIAAAPIVVAIEGPAVGGGAQLALAGDIRLGGRSALFRFPGPGHGLSVGPWGLTSVVGRGRALEISLTMRAVEAEEALAIGLLNRVEDDPRGSAIALAEKLGRLDRAAVATTKAIVRSASGLDDALELERAGNASWSGSVQGLGRPTA
jgi:enoyl-CoA hydratase/carnithine racemase